VLLPNIGNQNKMALEQKSKRLHTQHGHIKGLLTKANNDQKNS